MKQKDLIKKLKAGGFIFDRHGSNHDIYTKGDISESVPRHKEVDERLAIGILRRNGLL